MNGNRTLPDSRSSDDTWRTTLSSVWSMNEQTWHPGLSHAVALRLEKSDGMLAEPDK